MSMSWCDACDALHVLRCMRCMFCFCWHDPLDIFLWQLHAAAVDVLWTFWGWCPCSPFHVLPVVASPVVLHLKLHGVIRHHSASHVRNVVCGRVLVMSCCVDLYILYWICIVMAIYRTVDGVAALWWCPKWLLNRHGGGNLMCVCSWYCRSIPEIPYILLWKGWLSDQHACG